MPKAKAPIAGLQAELNTVRRQIILQGKMSDPYVAKYLRWCQRDLCQLAREDRSALPDGFAWGINNRLEWVKFSLER